MPITTLTHGYIKRRGTSNSEYNAWVQMKQRCYNPKDKSYKNYGKRGIFVCVRWLQSFTNFLEDMGPKPSVGHSLERRNNNLSYSPDNCYWATPMAQGRNKRNNVWMTLNGERKLMRVWAEELGFHIYVLKSRRRAKWSDLEALTIPVDMINSIRRQRSACTG